MQKVVESTPKSQRELLRGLSSLPLRMPTTTRELFQFLATCDGAKGIAGLLQRLDLSGVTPSHVYRLVHGRVAETPGQAVAGEDYDPREHLRGALFSQEFQANILRGLLTSFPEKRREVFIHVPKCAGTDLILNLAPRRLSIPQLLGVEGWLPREEFLAAVIEIAKAMPFFEDVFIFGHLELCRFVEACGVRHGDTFFTIIRDPFDLLLSQANYAVSRLRQDPESRDPDTRSILKALDLPRLPESPSYGFLKELTVRCLLDPTIVHSNRICHHLGQKDNRSYRTAISNLVTYDIEVTTAASYSRWLRERWSIQSDSQHNRSTTFLTRREAERLFSDVVADRIAEDQKFYDVVDWALREAGTASIHGTELARLAGASVLDEAPQHAATQLRDSRHSRRGGLAVAAHGVQHVGLYLEKIPARLVSPQREPKEALQIGFGAAGNSREYIGKGWCRPEPEFTWTSGSSAELFLPRPPPAESYLLQIQVAPFVVKDRVPQQRLGVSVNGIVVGEASISDHAVVECELPWSLLVAQEMVEIAFTLPDAAQASSVKEVQDHRVLAISVRSLALIAMGDVPEKPIQELANSAASVDSTLPELLTRFESLGENCEFGLVQRRAGVEPLGLLRFSSTPFPPLLRALRARFAGLGEAGSLVVEVAASGREYMVADSRYGFRYHAWVKLGEMEPEAILLREQRRVPFLVEKLIQDLTGGEKIFVFHGMQPLTEAEARDLAAAIAGFGPGTLLWVELADAAHPPGSVIRLGPNLLKGHMDRFAPGENAHDLSFACWLTLCRNALEAARVREAA